jgi:hypothetical protein
MWQSYALALSLISNTTMNMHTEGGIKDPVHFSAPADRI